MSSKKLLKRFTILTISLYSALFATLKKPQCDMKNAELRNPTTNMANVWLYENFLGIVKCMLSRESAELF